MEKSLNQEQKETFETLLKSIIRIDDLNGNEIKFNNLEVKCVKSQFSKVFSNILFIDNIPCTSNKRHYKITYKCRCGNIKTILLRKFLLKTKLKCCKCNQLSEFGGIGHNNPNRPKTIQIQKRQLNFDNETKEFKESYFIKHLTPNEFKIWLPKIYQINDIIITDNIRKKIIYLPHEQCNNQSKYTDMILLDNKKISIHDVYLKCEICGKIQRVHTNNLKNKNINFIKCKQCALSNTTFPIQKYLNTNLTYHSSIEKEFLDICFNKNIEVENGLKIQYEWNGKSHKYISDFYLPKYRIIIELKSNNIFYRQQKASGKLDAKNNGAIKYAKENNMKFVFLFDNEIQNFFDTLLNE